MRSSQPCIKLAKLQAESDINILNATYLEETCGLFEYVRVFLEGIPFISLEIIELGRTQWLPSSYVV